MEKLKTNLNFDGFFCVDCYGQFRAGGITLLWKSHYDVSLRSCSLNHLDVIIKDSLLHDEWRFIGVYGFPDEALKYKTWQLLQALHLSFSLLWLCVGDFNEILYNLEKKGLPNQ